MTAKEALARLTDVARYAESTGHRLTAHKVREASVALGNRIEKLEAVLHEIEEANATMGAYAGCPQPEQEEEA